MFVNKGSLKDVLMMDFEDLDCTVLLERGSQHSVVCSRNIKAVLENLQYTLRLTARFRGHARLVP